MDAFELLCQIKSKRRMVAVVGDLMLDLNRYCSVRGHSPERHDVTVLRESFSDSRAGGAGAVACMLAALDCGTFAYGVIGDDVDGRSIRTYLSTAGVACFGVVQAHDRLSTRKERLFVENEQVYVRIDRENTHPISDDNQRALLGIFQEHIAAIDCVVISDYGKGVCTPHVIARVTHLCKSHGVPLIVDPARGTPFSRYRGADVIKCNNEEFIDGMRDAGWRDSARVIVHTNGCRPTRICSPHGGWVDVPVEPGRAVDPTGAGDQFCAGLAAGIAAAGVGAVYEAACLGSLAGTLNTQRVGANPVSWQTLHNELVPVEPSAEIVP